jgi:transposase InsO family protein
MIYLLKSIFILFNHCFNLHFIVNVAGKWHYNYICLLINLFNREIIGYSVGDKKDAELVYESFMSTNINLTKVKVFHTDRGLEELKKDLRGYVLWYSYKRIHSSLNYMTPVEYSLAKMTE